MACLAGLSRSLSYIIVRIEKLIEEKAQHIFQTHFFHLIILLSKLSAGLLIVCDCLTG
jgi:hypothetical protein